MADVPGESVAQARARWLAEVAPLPAEPVRVQAGLGRVLAADLLALVDSPAYAVSAMDGIAVVAAESRALTLAPGRFARVDTGDLLPAGFDAVVPVERVTLTAGTAVVREAVEPGRHVRHPGEDLRRGELLLPAGQRLRPVDLGLAVAAGRAELQVRTRPRVVVVPTGDEVRPAGTELEAGQVADSSSAVVAGLAEQTGALVQVTAIVPDDPVLLTAAVQAAVGAADLVVVLAGSSRGRDDHTVAVLASLGTVVAAGLSMRPGQPTTLASVGGVPVLAAPGPPVAAWLAMELLGLPAVRALLAEPAAPQSVQATLDHDVRSPLALEDHLRVQVTAGRVSVLAGGSSSLAQLARADGVLVVPVGCPGWRAGSLVEVRRLPGAYGRNHDHV